MNKKGRVAAAVILGVVVLSFIAVIWLGNGGDRGTRSLVRKSGEAVGLVKIEGTISDSSDIFGEGGSQEIVDLLDDAAEDPSIKAVVLRVNTPGGSASASWEISEAVRRVKAAGKPVVVSMGSQATSGGYYVSALADRIIATPSTMTGSIGVIMSLANLQGLFDKIGYQQEVIKSGPYKDIGSESREMLPEEREILQTMVDEIYDQFVQVVAEGRKMDAARVRELADGRIMTGEQALAAGLVDELGDLNRAVEVAAELAGIEGEPKVVELGSSRSPLSLLLGEENDNTSLAKNALAGFLMLAQPVEQE